MSDESTEFTLQENLTSSSSIIATGVLQYNPSTNAIDGISGTINGSMIDGLSTYNGADNIAYSQAVTYFPTFYFLSLDNSGLSFAANGVSYNISHQTSAPTMLYGQMDTLVSSEGVNETVFFQAESSAFFCFAQGTQIQTLRGEVAVEKLQVGDALILATGLSRAVAWVGHRTVERPSFEQSPIRIRAGAFGHRKPLRDLYLSPGHPVLVGADEDGRDGYLVPIMCLINGTTIERVQVDSVTYWHVELDQHDILLAEGLPAESYLDCGCRAFFKEASEHTLHNPDFIVPGLGARCRPVAVDGQIVEGERRRLDAVFAAKLNAQCAWPENEFAA